MAETVIVTISNASLDDELRLQVSLTPRLLRALVVLAELQQFHCDGHFDLTADPGEVTDAPRDDDELVEFVVNSGADEAQIDDIAQFIEGDLLGG